MSRQIPIALQSNLDQPVQKYTHCIRIQLKNGVVTGFTPWTEVVEYDHQDGFGPIAYAAGGLDISEFEADTAYSVTNAEGRILVGTTLPGITPEMVRAGELDRLKTCAAGDCDDVVVDLSRNRSRRFCDGGCGNRENVRAYRDRQRSD